MSELVDLVQRFKVLIQQESQRFCSTENNIGHLSGVSYKNRAPKMTHRVIYLMLLLYSIYSMFYSFYFHQV